MTTAYRALYIFKTKYEQFAYMVAFISHKYPKRWILLLSSTDDEETKLSKLPHSRKQGDEIRDKVRIQTQAKLLEGPQF